MTVPNNQGVWPEELGGRIYPPGERCKVSKQFLSQLRKDCPDCPAMPDHENGADAQAAAAIPSEAYLFLPPWIIFSWVSKCIVSASWHEESSEGEIILIWHD